MTFGVEMIGGIVSRSFVHVDDFADLAFAMTVLGAVRNGALVFRHRRLDLGCGCASG